MSAQFQLIKNPNIKKISQSLFSNRELITRLETSSILEFLEKFGQSLPKTEHSLAEFLRSKNLKKILNISLHNDWHVLDKFVSLGSVDKHYRALPKGIIVHWVAGNVPVLGFYSLVLGLLTKNTNIIKVPSSNYEPLLRLVKLIGKVKTRQVNGKNLLKTISVLYIDHQDLKNQTTLSSVADVRLVWGGKEAVNSITKLPKKLGSEDVFFGPKYSYAIISRDIKDQNIHKYAQQLAIDISIFDQHGCNSPHTVFVEKGGPLSSIKFSKLLAQKMELVERTLLPKTKIDPETSMRILSVRNKFMNKGKVFSSKGTTWTVIHTRNTGFEDAHFSRTVFVKEIANISQIGKFHLSNLQSIGIANESRKRLLSLAELLTKESGNRLIKIGTMSQFEIPWDGSFVLDRMVRWVSLDKNL